MKTVNSLYIASKNVNLEIIAKLLNSVAVKYDCHVRYIARDNRLTFHGDETIWRHIAEEVMAFFSPRQAMVPVQAGGRPDTADSSGFLPSRQ